LNSRSREVAGMFDRISPTYDFLNRLFSLGTDRRWRAVTVRALDLRAGLRVLDCSAGTGDMSLEAHLQTEHIITVLLDPAHAMLARADSKAGTLPPAEFRLVQGVAEHVPFPDASFDRFMVAFGIRNFADLPAGLRELRRVLKPGGYGAILEFTPDRSRLIDRMFQWYMQRVMRPLGAKISRDPEAYNYLARTVQAFSTSDELRKLLEGVGFAIRMETKFSLGIARAFIVERREE
jgi:demethylmenaquinone methyltransferase / 2-methoxy-6-polyprenyl-1,4-benzoquinol methylase